MHFSNLVGLLALSAAVSAKTVHRRPRQCITDAVAQELVDAYVSLTSGATAFDQSVAEALLAPTFSDSTSSVASIIDGGKNPRSSVVGAAQTGLGSGNEHTC